MNNRLLPLLFLLLLCFPSCKDKEVEALKSAQQTPYTVKVSEARGTSDKHTLARTCRDQELAMNQAFVRSLEESANGAFERQLKKFEDEEFGFFTDLGYMFTWIFKLRETLEEEWKLKEGRYFSDLNTRAEFPLLARRYRDDVTALRRQFTTRLGQAKDVSVTDLEVQTAEVHLDGMIDHARNNLVFEVSQSILEFLSIGLLIAFLVSFIAPGVGQIVWFVIALILSVVFSMWNDNKAIESIREQYHHKQVSYDGLLKRLNQQTERTYAPWIN